MVEAKHVGPAEQNDGAWKTPNDRNGRFKSERQNKEHLSGKGVSPLDGDPGVCAQRTRAEASRYCGNALHYLQPFKICLDRATRYSWKQETASPWLSCDGSVTWTPLTEH